MEHFVFLMINKVDFIEPVADSALHRIPTILAIENLIPVSKISCFIRPEHLIWVPWEVVIINITIISAFSCIDDINITFQTCASMMLAVVALDRLIFVSQPLWWLRQPAAYAYKLAAIAYIPAAVEVVVVVVIVVSCHVCFQFFVGLFLVWLERTVKNGVALCSQVRQRRVNIICSAI